MFHKDRGAALRLGVGVGVCVCVRGGGGGTLVTRYWEGTGHFFLLIL